MSPVFLQDEIVMYSRRDGKSKWRQK